MGLLNSEEKDMAVERKLKIGVLGPHAVNREQYECGLAVGANIARVGALLLCGGCDGMMAAAAEGAKSAGGSTMGILPGSDSLAANEFIDTVIPTGLGAFRNALLVRACDVVIAVYGAYGTLSEIAFALRLKVPVVGLNTWSVVRNERVDAGIHVVYTPEAAVELAATLASRH